VSRIFKLSSAVFGLVVGHLLYQYLQTEPNWGIAGEFIWLQVNAIVLYEILFGKP
jgi:hypothetical protein